MVICIFKVTFTDCNFNKQWTSKTQVHTHSNEMLIVTGCQPANQIQRILDHGHLLTVHDPEQESSELDTVILKALVKGKVLIVREMFKKCNAFPTL